MWPACPCWPTTRPISAPPCIDMGAGTTTMAVFSGGRFVHADGFALGGHHVTMDIARGLNTRIADAERIKAIYGSVLTGGSDERDMITVPPVGDDEREPPQFVSRATLVRIIKPRVEEILEMVRDRLAASPFAAEPRGARGADRRRQPAHRPCRSGRAHPRTSGAHRPSARHRRVCRRRPRGRPSRWRPACWSTRRRRISNTSNRGERGNLMTGTGGYIARVGRWLRESF